MDGKGRLFCQFLILSAAVMTSCIPQNEPADMKEICEVILKLECPGYATRAQADYETKISEIDIYIYEEGILDESISLKPDGKSGLEHKLRLAKGRKYTICASANFGDRIMSPVLSELEEELFELEDPLNGGRGIPMYGMTEDVLIEDGTEVILSLTRLMAKISLRIDRSRLSRDVNLQVTGVSIGNCPRNARILSESKARSRYDCFENGYQCTAEDCGILNTIGAGGLSEPVSVFMLENMQGEFPSYIGEDEEKVLDSGDPLHPVSSYIELRLHYASDTHFINDKELVYRFYLGGSLNDLDIERNCHYHIDIVPEDDGLAGSGWRVDKSGIGTFAQEIILSENVLSMTYKGEEHRLETTILPECTTFKDLSWSSDDTSVATVGNDGTVTAVGEGECNINCIATDRSVVSATCRINVEYAPPSFAMYPGDFIEGDIGDEIRIWCEFFPPNAPFDPGYEELNFDKSRGIYDYEVDPDGKGVTLYLRNPGTGIVYMTAGAPINRSGMTIVVVRSSGDNGLYTIPLSHPAFPEYLQKQDCLLHHRLQDQGLSPSPQHG